MPGARGQDVTTHRGTMACTAFGRRFSSPELLTPVTHHQEFPVRKFYGLGRGVGRGLADGPALGVGVGRGVAVGDAVAVGLAVGVAVAAGVAVGVGVGVPPPPASTAAKISTRPQPYTLFGGPAAPHRVEAMWTAVLFKASRLWVSWCRRLGIADHSKAIAPAMWGVAMDVPLKFAYELSLAFVDERVPVPGATMSGLIRPLPSAVTGPRLLNPAIVSVPVVKAPAE